MKKIIHIQLQPILSGVQKVCLDEMRNLGKEYEQILVCSSTGTLTDLAKKEGVRTITINSLVRDISPWNDLKSLIKLVKLFKDLKPDIIHTHSSKTGFLGRVAAKIAGVKKIVHTVHGFAFPSTNNRLLRFIYFAMEYIAALCTDDIIVMNEDDYLTALNKLPIKKNRVHLIYNAVEIIGDEHSEFSRDIIINHDKYNIIMVGRLCEQKNPILLLKAFLKLKDDQTNLYIVGDGPQREYLEKFIEQNELNDKVFLLGWRDNVQHLLPHFDLFVLPSLWEGMPLAILEAMAARVPVICSDIPANNFLISKSAGMLFESNNDEALKQKIKKMLNNAQLQNIYRQKAYDSIRENFNLKDRINKIVGIYGK
ncbi:Putative glycosyltransferase EpsF [Mixta theicola]|nr:glycosyltransferase family 4 protein [Mixta theicola]QHM74988.1 Putative glycosyltransferase EpsF [Mixta theicola]